MTTRYVVDSEGRPVEAILDIEVYRALVEARRELAEANRLLSNATAEVERTTSDLAIARQTTAMNAVVQAQLRLTEAMQDLGDSEELEDLEATRAHDEDTELLEDGEEETVPLREALPRIEAERAAPERRGKL